MSVKEWVIGGVIVGVSVYLAKKVQNKIVYPDWMVDQLAMPLTWWSSQLEHVQEDLVAPSDPFSPVEQAVSMAQEADKRVQKLHQDNVLSAYINNPRNPSIQAYQQIEENISTQHINYKLNGGL